MSIMQELLDFDKNSPFVHTVNLTVVHPEHWVVCSK